MFGVECVSAGRMGDKVCCVYALDYLLYWSCYALEAW
jgi:hypothetical protein